jgi:DNA-binding transcriptional ArsR family regulator
MAPASGTGGVGTEEAGARGDAVREWLEGFDPASSTWEADLSPVAMAIVDAILHADPATLEQIAEPLRDTLARLFEDEGHAREARGYLLGALEATRWGQRRMPDPTGLDFAHDSHATQMLAALEIKAPLTSAELRERLSTSDSQLSRVGRQLLARGLVVQRRAGRMATWELSSRGRQALRDFRGDGRGRTAG